MATKRIEGRAKTIRELLQGARFSIDFYQREYAWKERQVRELIEDLTAKFLDFYSPSDERADVEGYGHYFLGSIVISHKQQKRYIVDGQQRLTTLTLLLIHLHHLQAEMPGSVDVRDLIFSEKFGRRSFNIDVDQRTACMDSLLRGESFDTEEAIASVQNLVARFQDIADYMPDEVKGKTLPYFVDWLLENVHLVEIEAYSDEDAYTIFETMNDRGLSLSLPEMLKGYVLANIRDEADQRRVNDLWKSHMQRLKEHEEDRDVDFFKAWLRGRHAETIRPGNKGAENKDYERIGSEFHRWVRDQRQRLGLTSSEAFVRFVERDLDFYAKLYLRLLEAANTLTPGLESVRFNEARGFSAQFQVLLASVTPDDAPEVVEKKVRLAADYLDIWLARRVWNYRTIAQSSTRYGVFTLCKSIRSMSAAELAEYLRAELDSQPENFASKPWFRLHGTNYRQVKHILARLSHWVDEQCGERTQFDELVAEGRNRPFEIEHLWANSAARYADWYPTAGEFEVARNRLGALVLLQRGPNQSLGDKPYRGKRDAYVAQGQCLLTKSLHPLAYEHNPSFARLRKRPGLSFEAIEDFTPEALERRQELYVRIAEWVWNPGRLTLGEVEPPEPIPFMHAGDEDDVEDDDAEPTPERRESCKKLFALILANANESFDLHRDVAPKPRSYVSAQRFSLYWNYGLTEHSCRIALRIDLKDEALNEQILSRLYEYRAAVEERFGEPLNWERPTNGRYRRVSLEIDGGWADEAEWPDIAKRAAATMQRFYAALEGPAREVMEKIRG